MDSHPGTARRSREWPRSHATGWECCEHPCLPALLKCGFREMAPREEKESHRRGVTHVLCLRSTSRIWGFMQPSPDRAIVAWVSAQGARRCVCAPAVVCVAVGGRDPVRRVKECFLKKTKKTGKTFPLRFLPTAVQLYHTCRQLYHPFFSATSLKSAREERMHAQFVCIYAWVEGRSACCLAKGPRAGGGPGGQPGLRRGVLEASRVTGMMVTARVVKLPLRAYSCSRLSSPPQARNGKKSQHVVTVFFLPSLQNTCNLIVARRGRRHQTPHQASL